LVDKAIQRAIEMKELRAENQELDRMLVACEEDSQEELAKANRQEEYLESRIEHYMNTTGDALEENDKLKKEVQGLKHILSRFEEKYTKLYEEQQETKEDTEMLRADYASLRESHDNLKTGLASNDVELEQWRLYSAEKQEEVKRLNAELARRSAVSQDWYKSMQRLNDELYQTGVKLDKAKKGIKKLTEVKQDLESKLDIAQMVIGQQQQSLADKETQIQQLKMHGEIGVFHSRDHVIPTPGRFAIVLGSPSGSKNKKKKTELWFATLGQVDPETKEAQIALYYAWQSDHDNPQAGTMRPCNAPKDAPKPNQKLPYGTYYCVDRFPSGPKDEYDEFIAKFCEDMEPVDNCTLHSEEDHARRRRP
jgi:hypothetical protein